MVIDGYELSKYIDPVTARIMNFIHKAKILYSCNEDNNTRNLKYTYLNMCAYNKEKENVDYYKLLAQGPIERRTYAEKLNIPNSLVYYLTDREPGEGVINTPADNVAFNDRFEKKDDPFYGLFYK